MKPEATKVTVELAGGKQLSIETGKLAKQAGGAAVVRFGDNVVLATATANPEPRVGIDFFPLTVDYREYTYAGGRIPGGFIKREGRMSEREVLTSRQIDRPVRPMFAEGFKNETQVIAFVLSADTENDPDVSGINAASAALTISDIPFIGPIGAVRVGLVDGRFIVNPTYTEMREGLLVIDAEMRVVASNRAARSLFGPVDDSIHLRRLTELTRNPAIYDAFLDAVRGTERAGVKVETYQQAKRIFDLRVVPLRSGNRRGATGAVGVFFDVTRLERLEVVRQEFLSNVSHELRTQLTSIMALAETLEAGAINDQHNNRRFLSIIQKNAARMQRLIDDILELSAIEAGNVKVQPENVHLHALVEDITGSFLAMASVRRITIRNLVELEIEVFADPHRLMQMLTNLIENALK